MRTQLSLVNRSLNYLEDFQPQYIFRLRWVITILLLILFSLITDYDKHLMRIIPSQINPFFHTGNLASTPFAIFGGFVSGVILARFFIRNERILLVISTSIGTLVGLTANIYVESASGMLSLKEPNTGDIFDVIWGTLFCFLTLLAVLKVERIKSTKK
jgi:hypothetical protein